MKNFDEAIPVEEQTHAPLGFVSGIFTGSEYNWKTQSKECYVIYATITKIVHITRCHPFRVYSNNKNLTSIYQPDYLWASENMPRPSKM